MRIIIVTILAALIAGCATSGDVMQRAPVASFPSLKPADAVTSCLATAMLAKWPQTKVVPSGDGQMIVVSGSAWGNPVVIFTVERTQRGSHITARRGSVADAIFNGIDASAQGCT